VTKKWHWQHGVFVETSLCEMRIFASRIKLVFPVSYDGKISV
jgi:hypothetical protein